jgi:hypothetical protein
MMAKYNYSIFLAGLVGGALLTPFRRVVLHRRFLVALVLCAALFLPHLLWTLTHLNQLLPGDAGLSHGMGAARPGALLSGFGKLVVAVLSFSAPLGFIYLATFRSGFPEKFRAARWNSFDRLLLSHWAVILGVCLVLLLFFQVTGFKDRWFQPMLVSLPLFAAESLWSRAERREMRRLLGFSVAVAFLALFLVPAQVVFGPALGKPTRLNAPFSEFAERWRHRLSPDDWILAENRWLGGNLRMAFPENRVCVPELSPPARLNSDRALLVWIASEQHSISPSLLGYLAASGGVDESKIEPQYAEAPYKYGTGETMRLGYAWIRR